MITRLLNKERTFWISLVILIIFGGYCNSAQYGKPDSDPDAYAYYMDIYKEAYYTVKKRFSDSGLTDPRFLIYNSISGMFDSLKDPYSYFLDDRQLAYLNHLLEGSFAGVGFSIIQRHGQLIVTYTFPDSPARKAGVQSRDRIVEVDGKPIKGLPIQLVVQMLQGKPNTKVTITIERGKSNSKKKIVITRAVISSPDIDYKILRHDIAYINFKTFTNGSAQKVREVLYTLKKKKIKGIIFDVRHNPGGALLDCLHIVNYFLPDNKKVVFIREKKNNYGLYHYTDGRLTIFPKIPLVVLSDENSASASEIFVGAIQDHKRGVIIGRKTFGKGSVQSIIPSMVKGSVGYRLTHSKWFTPNGRAINGVGLKPDINIEKEPDLTIDEKYYTIKLFKSRLIEKYVEEHPQLTPNEIHQFMTIIKKRGYQLPKRLVSRFLKDEKYLFHYGTVVDMSYDRVLKKGYRKMLEEIKQ